MQRRIDNFTNEEINFLIKEVKSFRQLMLRLGYSTNGSGDYVYVKQQLDYKGIDYSELLQRVAVYGNIVSLDENGKMKRKYSNEEVFIENSVLDRASVKKRIIDEKLIPYICNDCGITNEWNGKKLVLQLEHKNGKGDDNRLENLCFLCPNCHSQTATYTSKKIKKYNYCKCGKIIFKTSKSCNDCADKRVKIKNRPTLETLIQEIKEFGYHQLSKKYDVSDNTIRKWVKRYGVDPSTIKKLNYGSTRTN